MTYKTRKQLRLLQNKTTNTLEQEVVSDGINVDEIPQWKEDIANILEQSNEITKAKDYKEFITTKLEQLLKGEQNEN